MPATLLVPVAGPKTGAGPTFQWAGKVDAICRSRSNRAKRPRAGCILRSIICPSSSPSTPIFPRLIDFGEPTSTSGKRIGHSDEYFAEAGVTITVEQAEKTSRSFPEGHIGLLWTCWWKNSEPNGNPSTTYATIDQAYRIYDGLLWAEAAKNYTTRPTRAYGSPSRPI